MAEFYCKSAASESRSLFMSFRLSELYTRRKCSGL